MTGPSTPVAFEHLTFSEKLLLWGVRLWVRSFQQNTSAHEILGQALRLAGANHAVFPLDDVMTLIATGSRARICINCPNCPDISADEFRILGAIAAWQQEPQGHKAIKLLAVWLPASALRIIRVPGSDLAQSFAVAGLKLPQRQLRDHPVSQDSYDFTGQENRNPSPSSSLH